MSDTTTRKPRRWVKVLAWTGSVLGVLIIAAGGLGFTLLYAPTPEEPELAAQVSTATLTVDGMERSYTVVVPDSLEPGADLYIALHGSNMDAAGMRATTGYQLDVLAAEQGFVAVYPQGYENTWNDCRAGTTYPASLEGIDDVAFLEALVGELAETYGVDAGRVFGIGYSNGAHMLFRMASQSPGTFAGIEANAASYSTPDTFTCAPLEQPVPVILVEGTADPINPYAGGGAGFGGEGLGAVLSAQDSAAYLAEVNGVAGTPEESVVGGEPGESGAVTLTAYGAGTATPVLLYTVEGGGHMVPNPVARQPRIMGGSTEHLNAPAVAWEVFSQLP